MMNGVRNYCDWMKSRVVHSLLYWATGRRAVSSSGLQFQQRWQKPKSCTCFSLILLEGPGFPRTNLLGEMGAQARSPRGRETVNLGWCGRKCFTKEVLPGLVRAPLAKWGGVGEVADHVSCRGWAAAMPIRVAMMICQCTVVEQGLGHFTYS